MGFMQVIDHYRGNRKILLLIVYIALFLDNMLLTTIVPIIPEYLMKLNHPNDSAAFLHVEERMKREVSWDDDSWDVPMISNNENINWDENPFFGPKNKNEKSKNRSKGKNRQRTTPEPMEGNPLTERTRMRPEGETREEGQGPTPSLTAAQRHNVVAQENIMVGVMFGSKALVQLFANPWIGPLTNRIGYTLPMFGGFVIMFLSTILFAFGESYGTLWFARAMQGIGSACTSTSGMGMLAQAYPDDAERGSAMGIALGGLALGVLVGPPYGGVLYQWSGKELPFILLAMLALFDGSLQFAVLQPKVSRGEPEGSTIKQLIKDPYILVGAGAITIGNLGIAMLEPSLPLWMMESWGANSLERGAAFLPASISYLIGTNIFGPLAHRVGRWLSAFIGLIVIGFCLLAIPSAHSVGGLICPHFFMGFSIGMIDASMFPLMGHLVDLRHVGVYGSIYAIADAAFCFAFALGPFFSGPLVRSVGFPTMMYIIAIINFAYAPLMFLLRDPPPIVRQEPQTQTPSAVAVEAYEKIEGQNVTRMQDYQYEY